MKIKLFFKPYPDDMSTQIQIVNTKYTTLPYSGKRGGVVYGVCRIIFHIQRGIQVIIGIKLNIRTISGVTMLKHIILYKRV